VDRLTGLRGVSGASRSEEAWRPVLFDLERDEDQAALDALLASGGVRFVHDTLLDQLAELVAAREPRPRWPKEALFARVKAHLGGRDPLTYGTWVFLPWSARLVHVLPREELREVRTDRNRYKITREEQKRLERCRIGVIGLSVGNMAAITFALEGIGASFKIADFDRLSLSNLNRLRSGVQDLGVEKTVLAAREMFEIDPYLEVLPYSQGVNPDNIDDFLIGGGRLDLLVEECDDLYVKVSVRERARLHRIPVIMDTSDRGLLDVERFDREPARPVFHGLVGDLKADGLRGLETKDKVPFFLAIVDGQRMSTRMAASLPEIDHSIGTWPQLASGVALGGAITADVARRILLGEHTESGRYYVDPALIVADGQGMLREPAPPPAPLELSPEAIAPRRLPPAPARDGRVSADAVRFIVALATLAPSAHNAQPWKFRFARGRLECRHDSARDLPNLDFDHCATWVAFGAAFENIVLAAGHLGLAAVPQVFPTPDDPSLVCSVELVPAASARTDPLFSFVTERVTNRKRDARVALDEGDARALASACEGSGGRLELVKSPAELDEIGALMGACDRIVLLNRAMHHDAMHGYRWTRAEVERHRDGLDVASMEFTPAERAGLRLLEQWRTLECLGAIGGGRALEDLSRKAVNAAAAVGLITVPGTGRESYFHGGRVVQRLWLTAASRGLALQPITGLPYLFARLERGQGVGLAPAEQGELTRLRERYARLFEVSQQAAEVLLFRLGRAGPPTARSLRRSLDDVLTLSE
jgi:nitroreductase